METIIVGCKLLDDTGKPMDSLPKRFQERILERFMNEKDWIESHASGTLRKNKKIGFAYKKQYWHERIAYEFGGNFEMLPKTRVTFGDANTESDCSSITEAGWYIERYLSHLVFDEDYLEVKYIFIEESDGTRKEGIGVVLRQTSFPAPTGNIIFCLLTEYNRITKDFMEVKVI
jgi:hypothetical protein